ncbi:MFS transporter [Nocardioides sp.]|uniref:MFS transporter n=1 Tax=Nocardioides sp. TaxID=35761 RepID=UPI0035169659
MRTSPATQPRLHPFRALLAASAAGGLADGIATTALPLLVLQRTDDPRVVALLPVALGLPWLLLGLPMGALADRVDRRRMLLAATAVRTALAAATTALVVADALTVPLLLLAALAEGAATVASRTAAPALVPALVDDDDLPRANGAVQSTTLVTASLIGPALGGTLFALAASSPLAVQTAAMAVAVAALLALPRVPAPTNSSSTSSAPTRTTLRGEILEGLRFTAREPTVRVLAISTALLAAATGVLQGVFVVHVVTTIGADDAAYGWLFTIFAVGALGGGALLEPARARWGAWPCLVVAAVLGGLGLVAIAAAPGLDPFGTGAELALAGAGAATLGAGSMAYNVTAVTERQQRTPPALLGRVTGLATLIAAGSVPLAALAGGLLASVAGTTSTLAVAGGSCAVAAVLLRAAQPSASGNRPAEPDSSSAAT